MEFINLNQAVNFALWNVRSFAPFADIPLLSLCFVKGQPDSDRIAVSTPKIGFYVSQLGGVEPDSSKQIRAQLRSDDETAVSIPVAIQFSLNENWYGFLIKATELDDQNWVKAYDKSNSFIGDKILLDLLGFYLTSKSKSSFELQSGETIVGGALKIENDGSLSLTFNLPQGEVNRDWSLLIDGALIGKINSDSLCNSSSDVYPIASELSPKSDSGFSLNLVDTFELLEAQSRGSLNLLYMGEDSYRLAKERLLANEHFYPAIYDESIHCFLRGGNVPVDETGLSMRSISDSNEIFTVPYSFTRNTLRQDKLNVVVIGGPYADCANVNYDNSGKASLFYLEGMGMNLLNSQADNQLRAYAGDEPRKGTCNVASIDSSLTVDGEDGKPIGRAIFSSRLKYAGSLTQIIKASELNELGDSGGCGVNYALVEDVLTDGSVVGPWGNYAHLNQSHGGRVTLNQKSLKVTSSFPDNKPLIIGLVLTSGLTRALNFDNLSPSRPIKMSPKPEIADYLAQAFTAIDWPEARIRVAQQYNKDSSDWTPLNCFVLKRQFERRGFWAMDRVNAEKSKNVFIGVYNCSFINLALKIIQRYCGPTSTIGEQLIELNNGLKLIHCARCSDDKVDFELMRPLYSELVRVIAVYLKRSADLVARENLIYLPFCRHELENFVEDKHFFASAVKFPNSDQLSSESGTDSIGPDDLTIDADLLARDPTTNPSVIKLVNNLVSTGNLLDEQAESTAQAAKKACESYSAALEQERDQLIESGNHSLTTEVQEILNSQLSSFKKSALSLFESLQLKESDETSSVKEEVNKIRGDRLSDLSELCVLAKDGFKQSELTLKDELQKLNDDLNLLQSSHAKGFESFREKIAGSLGVESSIISLIKQFTSTKLEDFAEALKVNLGTDIVNRTLAADVEQVIVEVSSCLANLKSEVLSSSQIEAISAQILLVGQNLTLLSKFINELGLNQDDASRKSEQVNLIVSALSDVAQSSLRLRELSQAGKQKKRRKGW